MSYPTDLKPRPPPDALLRCERCRENFPPQQRFDAAEQHLPLPDFEVENIWCSSACYLASVKASLPADKYAQLSTDLHGRLQGQFQFVSRVSLVPKGMEYTFPLIQTPAGYELAPRKRKVLHSEASE